MIQFRIQTGIVLYCDYCVPKNTTRKLRKHHSNPFNIFHDLPRLQAPFFAMSQSFPVQPTLTSQPSANLLEDSQKFIRKETFAFDDMLSEMHFS